MFRQCLILGIALMLTSVLASADDDLVPVSIQLQWVTQAQFAGYYVAQALGYYEDEGLAVTILESDGDIQPAEAVAEGAAEFGVTWLPKTLIANEQGGDLVNIAQIFQRSGTVLVSLASAGIDSISDLALKTVGYWPKDNEFEVYATTFVMGSDPISGEHLPPSSSSLFTWILCLKASWMRRRRSSTTATAAFLAKSIPLLASCTKNLI